MNPKQRRRHIFPDGNILFFRPSLITAVFEIDNPRDTVHGWFSFKYYFDGNIMQEYFLTEQQAEFERGRLVRFAGGEVLPPEMR